MTEHDAGRVAAVLPADAEVDRVVRLPALVAGDPHQTAHTGPIDSGVTDPELSFQTPNPSKDYPRVFNTRYLDIITRNSQYALVKPGFSDVAPVLKGL